MVLMRGKHQYIKDCRLLMEIYSVKVHVGSGRLTKILAAELRLPGKGLNRLASRILANSIRSYILPSSVTPKKANLRKKSLCKSAMFKRIFPILRSKAQKIRNTR